MAIGIAVAALVGACGGDARTNDRVPADAGLLDRAVRPSIEYVVLDGSLEAVRTEFNADSGVVRAILLAAPT